MRNDALRLKAIDKIQLVDFLLNNLDKSSKEVEIKWVEESEKRYDAYKAGKLKGISIQKIQAKYEK